MQLHEKYFLNYVLFPEGSPVTSSPEISAVLTVVITFPSFVVLLIIFTFLNDKVMQKLITLLLIIFNIEFVRFNHIFVWM